MPLRSAASARLGLRLGRGGRGQVPPLVGVLQVHRRSRRRRSLARRPMPPLRRRRLLLGALRDGAGPARYRGERSGRASTSELHSRPRLPARGFARAEFVLPRLGQLLGLPRPRDRQRGAFFGWRLFFERLPRNTPSSWSSRTCNGPTRACSNSSTTCSSGPATTPSSSSSSLDRGDRDRGVRLSGRHLTSVPLDPLSDEAMHELAGRARRRSPGSRPRSDRAALGGDPALCSRPCGCCSTEGAREASDGHCISSSEIGDIDTPPGLVALISARLDSLSSKERRLVKDCSVLGGSFPPPFVAAVSDLPAGDLADLLPAWCARRCSRSAPISSPRNADSTPSPSR